MRLTTFRSKEPVRVGFLPVSDCAPLVYAHEGGLFEKYDLDVELHRETRWADVRGKVLNGELDAAQAPATLPFLSNLDSESDEAACVSALVLSLQGNSITVSRELWDNGVRDAVSLREQVYKYWRKRTLTFGVVFPYSCQEVLLRRWLKSGGIVPGVEVAIVAVPPDQMFPTLKLGYIDGFCVGEPWTSVAVQAGVGKCLATSAALAPMHPEKVLMVRQSFALGSPARHERLLAALLEACAFCELPENRLMLSEMLAHPRYLNAPAECVKAGLVGPFQLRDDWYEHVPRLMLFHDHNANEPTDTKARWLMDGLYELLQESVFRSKNLSRTPVLTNVFRRDIFHRAQTALRQQRRRDTAEVEALMSA
jgi:ABC-type nitrate/sulfonate/bicarbonate transport system substrate-binding protein